MNFDWYLSHVFTDEEGALQVVAKRRLRPDARRRIEQAQKFINEYYASLNVIDALLQNINEVLIDIIDLTKNYQSRGSDTELLMSECLSSISRHLANTCSLFMSLVEHFNRYYKNNYGRKSIQCVRWLDLQNYHLNNSFEYRLMYGIRGYIQHVDMPPIEISIKEKSDDDNIEFSIELDIDKLRQDRQFEKELKIF